MSDKNNILYTAADIEKYHKGLLSPAEQHHMEKAALEDEMLADALEGYSFTQNVAADMADLQERIKTRLENEGNKADAPIKKISNYRQWLKIAALVIILAGAGALILNNKTAEEKNIARVEPAIEKNTPEHENAGNKIIESTADTAPATAPAPSVPPPIITTEKQAEPVVVPGIAITEKKQEVQEIAKAIETPALAKSKISLSTSDVKNDAQEKFKKADSNKDPEEVVVSDDKTLKKTPVTGASTIIKAAPEAKQAPTPATAPNKELTYSTTDNPALRANTVTAHDLSKLYFSGKITDNNQQSIPAASIVNIKNNQKVTADKNGYFKMPVTDSIIGISVNALGYQQNYFQLKQNTPLTAITLQPEENTLNEVVVVGYGTRKKSDKKNKKMDAASNGLLLTAQPAAGWKNFEQYCKKNTTLPPLPQSDAVVILTFKINELGSPEDIEVLVPLSDAYNKQAVRLLQTGGKWTPAPLNQKMVIKISFSK